jgi:hypothetical protein
MLARNIDICMIIATFPMLLYEYGFSLRVRSNELLIIILFSKDNGFQAMPS